MRGVGAFKLHPIVTLTAWQGTSWPLCSAVEMSPTFGNHRPFMSARASRAKRSLCGRTRPRASTELAIWRIGALAETASAQAMMLAPLARLHGCSTATLRAKSLERHVSERSRYEYRRALARIEDVATSTGTTVAKLPATSITSAAVDKIYAKLQPGPRGHRIRQANLSIDIARRAWRVSFAGCTRR